MPFFSPKRTATHGMAGRLRSRLRQIPAYRELRRYDLLISILGTVLSASASIVAALPDLMTLVA